MPLNLYASNDLSHLSRQLIAAMQAAPLEDVFEEHLVLVPSAGLRDWLRQQCAEQLGICGGIRFVYLAQFVDVIAEACACDVAFERRSERLPWLCLRAMQQSSELATYLGDEIQAPKKRSYFLANSLAACFERYALYRPTETLSAWARGETGPWDHDATWLPGIWRQVLSYAGVNPVEQQQQLLQALEQPQAKLPKHIWSFGFNNLAPFMLDILQRIAAQSEVHLYCLQPSWGYWEDQRSRRELLQDPNAWMQADVNRLLGDWGALGREFLVQLDERDAVYHAAAEDFRDPGTETLLQRLQHDALWAQTTPSYPPISQQDTSLQFHACHHLRRQLEVAKESIHEALHDPALTDLGIHEIAVMCPDPEAMLPYATALFQSTIAGPPLPVVIADQQLQQQHPVCDIVLQLLRLLPSRFTAHDIIDFIAQEAVAHAWGLGAAHIAHLQSWIERANLRWGLDAAHRDLETDYAFNHGSCEQALQRLHLAWWYGEDVDDAVTFKKEGAAPEEWVRPVADLELQEQVALRALSQIMQLCMDLAPRARQAMPLSWWSEQLRAAVSQILCLEMDDPEMAVLSQLFGQWQEDLDACHLQDDLDISLVHAHFESLCAQSQGGDYARGAITLCGLQPMRSIPFRVLCMVGMDDDAFPRRSQAQQFDLMALHPQRGDRDLRREDRYLLLELCTSVRERLCICYQGFDSRDHSPQAAAAIIGELQEIAQQTSGLDAAAFHKHCVLQHRLHRSLEAAPWPDAIQAQEHQLLQQQRAAFSVAKPILPVALPTEIELDAFISFWRNPAKAYIRQCGAAVPRITETADAAETLDALHGLRRFQAAEIILARADEASDVVYDDLASKGFVATAALGTYARNELTAYIALLKEQRVAIGATAPLHIDQHIAGVHVYGNVPMLHQEHGVLMFEAGEKKPKRLLRAWLYLLCAYEQAGVEQAQVYCVDKKKGFSVTTLQHPKDTRILVNLLQTMQRGQQQALPYIEELSQTYVAKCYDKKKPLEPSIIKQQLWERWTEEDFQSKQILAEQSEHAWLWPLPENPIEDPEFVDLAELVWLPLMGAES